MNQHPHNSNIPNHGGHRQYEIQIAGQSLQYVAKTVDDPVVTGSQILIAVGAHPAGEFLVFQVLRSGALEVVRPEEAVDLRSADAEKFIVFRSDRSFRFFLDERAFDWGASHISGATIKRLAEVQGESTDVWLDTAGGHARLIDDKELVDLASPGTERFVTRKISCRFTFNLSLLHFHLAPSGWPRCLISKVMPYSPR